MRTPAGDAAELTVCFMSEIDKDAGPILYVAARDRTGALAGGLSANGYDIRTCIAYGAEMETELPPSIRDALSARAIDGILFYSRRTAMAFRAIVAREGIAEQVDGIGIFALSGRVAEPLAWTIRKHPCRGETGRGESFCSSLSIAGGVTGSRKFRV